MVTTHTPLNWDYEIIGIVTAQTTTGTGVFAELSASISDFFGKQAHRYNSKLKEGENMCLSQLRTQTIQRDGNAVIAADIDYSEVGGDKGMLMVCMAGTAVKITNLDILGANAAHISKVYELRNRIRHLHSLQNN